MASGKTKFDDKKLGELKEAFEIFGMFSFLLVLNRKKHILCGTDQGGKGTIAVQHTGLIIRAVGQNPTEVMLVSLHSSMTSVDTQTDSETDRRMARAVRSEQLRIL